MKLIDYFDCFLKETVNLNQTRLDQLDARVQAIHFALGMDDTIGPILIDRIAQGSWAHRTIIKPLVGKEFDADVLMKLTPVEGWESKQYLKEVRAAFRRSSTYRDMVTKKNRCVRVVYANDCHVDVVPYMILDDGREVIVNFADNAFEDTNPDGLTDWMRERDGVANGNLRKVLRLLKYVRDYKGTFDCKSVVLTTLVGERISEWSAADRYKDVPTTLVSVLEDLAAFVALHQLMPDIADPSCPGTNFNHRWDQARYENFGKQITRYAAWAREAFDEQDKAKSLAAWQRIFGDAFKAPVAALSESSTALIKAAPSAVAAPREQFIEDQVAGKVAGYSARIDATVLRLTRGFRRGLMRRGQIVPKDNRLRFELTTDVPRPFTVYWKVRNYGQEAARANGLRGELMTGTTVHEESTLYRGRHFIEAFVVKDGTLWARARNSVDIA